MPIDLVTNEMDMIQLLSLLKLIEIFAYWIHQMYGDIIKNKSAKNQISKVFSV